MPTTLRLVKHARIRARLRCVTGLRIGGSKDDIEVGASDNPIIRHPLTKLPYIPGSSIKGKLRSTLEYREGKVGQNGNPCGCGQEDCLVCTIFGPHFNTRHSLGPTRILVRDAVLTEESRQDLFRLQEQEGLLFAESKTENMIDRRSGRATNPRTQERVPAGTVFALNISLRIFASDDEDKLVAFVKGGLEMLEDEYLGGSGSRGYGQVKLEDLEIER
jgi:CRISPR-associated protein Csm3